MDLTSPRRGGDMAALYLQLVCGRTLPLLAELAYNNTDRILLLIDKRYTDTDSNTNTNTNTDLT